VPGSVGRAVAVSLVLALAWASWAPCACTAMPAASDAHCAAHGEGLQAARSACCCGGDSRLQPQAATVVREGSPVQVIPLTAPVFGILAPHDRLLLTAPLPVADSPPPRLIVLRI